MWTLFIDAYTGGYKKTAYDAIFVEADILEAIHVAALDLGVQLTKQSCPCGKCGVSDFILRRYNTLPEASAQYRNLAHNGQEYVEGMAAGSGFSPVTHEVWEKHYGGKDGKFLIVRANTIQGGRTSVLDDFDGD